MTIKRWDEISGFFVPEDVEKLQELARDKVCLEVGSLLGRSTTAIAEVAKRVYAVDTFRASGDGADQVAGAAHEFTTLDGFCANTFGYTNIRICIGLSCEIAKTFDDNYLDLVLVDGSHKYEDVRDDIEAWWPKLKEGRAMAFHDYGGWDGVTKAVDERFADHEINGPIIILVWVIK